MSYSSQMLMSSRSPVRSRHAGFTLIELLVVLVIVLLVSAVALPVVLPALNHRQVNESARLLQGAFVGAQDAAVHADAPRGVRLLPDPGFSSSEIFAADRIVAIEPAPDYSEGRITARYLPGMAAPNMIPSVAYPGHGGGVYPFNAAGTALTIPVLMVEEQPFDSSNRRNAPTSWFWNIRVGDKLRFGNTGGLYTIVGPMTVQPADGNSELFVNVGPPGTVSPLDRNDSQGPREFLLLVNGQDDDGDGFTDEGWDGLDNNLNGIDSNNDGIIDNPRVDDVTEWETERWIGSEAVIETGARIFDSSYTIVRRPVPSANARETALPSGVVVDLTTWNLPSPERSRVPVDPFSGYVDVMFSPRGDVVPTSIYSTPASFSMKDVFFHFWLAERQDLYEPVSGTLPTFLPVPTGLVADATNSLKGEYRIVTLFTRSGQITTNEVADFDPSNANAPFYKAQQGVRGGQ